MASFYYDYRLGGIPRPVFGDPHNALMRVPDDLLKCTVFICVNTGAEYLPGGTAFFVSVSSDIRFQLYTYLVTAKHCVIDAQKYGDIFIRVNRRDGEMDLIKIEAPWIFPEDPSVDLAVLPMGVQLDRHDAKFVDHSMIASEDSLKQHYIGIGDDVVIAGLFTRRSGRKKNIPIVRIGNIAAMPDEPLSDSITGLLYHAYLLEARSIGGLSGSPVFAMLPSTRPNKDGVVDMTQSYMVLIGIIRGHWDHEEPKLQTTVDYAKELEQVNMGVATATPAEELRKIIFGDMLVTGRKEHDAEIIKKNAPKNDSAFPERALTKQEFEEALKKASRKIERPK
jgi:hypothetical protein